MKLKGLKGAMRPSLSTKEIVKIWEGSWLYFIPFGVERGVDDHGFFTHVGGIRWKDGWKGSRGFEGHFSSFSRSTEQPQQREKESGTKKGSQTQPERRSDHCQNYEATTKTKREKVHEKTHQLTDRQNKEVALVDEGMAENSSG